MNELKSYEINIESLDSAEMITALYNAASTGFGIKVPDVSVSQVQEYLNEQFSGKQGNRLYIDYLFNKPLKIHFGRPILDTRLYDRDNGIGAAKKALEPLLEK